MHIALLVLYPVLVHLSILLGIPYLQAFALISLCAGLTYHGLKRGNIVLWVFLLGFATASLTLARFNWSLYLLYVPPVALPLMLAVIFINTLLPGKEPLVTAIGEASRGPLSPEMRRYTRGVTLLWSIVFCLMIATAIILPLSHNKALWSWITNIGNYLLIGILFLGEFIYRKIRFPDHNHPGFIEYIKIVVTANVPKR